MGFQRAPVGSTKQKAPCLRGFLLGLDDTRRFGHQARSQKLASRTGADVRCPLTPTMKILNTLSIFGFEADGDFFGND
jgi:hypothetical protein